MMLLLLAVSAEVVSAENTFLSNFRGNFWEV